MSQPTDVVVKPREVMPGGATTLPAPVLHRSDTSAARWIALFATMWICAGRLEQVERPGQFFLREVLGESIIVTRERVRAGATRSTTSAGIAARRLCTEPGRNVRRQHPVPVSRVDLRSRRTADRRAAHGRSAALPQGRTTRCIAVHADVWDGHIFMNLSQEPRPLARAARPICRASSAAGACRISGSDIASSTT